MKAAEKKEMGIWDGGPGRRGMKWLLIGYQTDETRTVYYKTTNQTIHSPGLCVANKAPTDTDVTRKLLNISPRKASQYVEALSIKRAAVFLS